MKEAFVRLASHTTVPRALQRFRNESLKKCDVLVEFFMAVKDLPSEPHGNVIRVGGGAATRRLRPATATHRIGPPRGRS